MTEKKEFVCAQDLREEELKKEGKTYFRIGRAIFIVEKEDKPEISAEEAFDTPLGTAIALSGKPEKLEDSGVKKLLQELCLPTGYLRVTIEGDPDAGIDCAPNVVQLTGYRFGLDDVIVDGKLLHTTHGSDGDIMRNFADELEWNTWRAMWVKKGKKRLENKMKRTAETIRQIAKELEATE